MADTEVVFEVGQKVTWNPKAGDKFTIGSDLPAIPYENLVKDHILKYGEIVTITKINTQYTSHAHPQFVHINDSPEAFSGAYFLPIEMLNKPVKK